MIVNNLPEVTGDAAAHAFVSDARKAKWVQVVCPAANGAVVRVGGADTSATVGLPIPAGGGMFLPAITDPMEFYPLNAFYYYAGSGDKINLIYTTDGTNQ